MKTYPRKIITLCLVSCAMAAALPSCSNIDEADRLVAVNVVQTDTIAPPEPEPDPGEEIDYYQPFSRHVLIEDFTGQDCINCPNATDLIKQLQEMNGHDKVVAVGIHSGPLGVKPSKNPQGLATDLGDTYYNYWHIEQQPYGVIDRSDGILSTDWWSGKVTWDLSADNPPATQLNIFVKAEKAADSNVAQIDVTLAGMQGTTNGRLQVWITEDNITAFQKMPNGSTNNDYVHNHVLRDAVNGDWGVECTVTEKNLTEMSYTYTLPAAWKAENLAVVAFVYTSESVIQVVRQPLKIEE